MPPIVFVRYPLCDWLPMMKPTIGIKVRTGVYCLFDLRETEDDVLIVRRGWLTDTSICNIALWNGKQWITPSVPLLAGTKRASLLDRGEMVAGDIRPEDLPGYSRIRLFNAMIEFGEIDLSVDKIVLWLK